MTPPVPIVVLAAGASRRLGEPKQLVRFGGKSLLAGAVATARAAASGPVYVVLGAGLDDLNGEIGTGDVTVIPNHEWAEGMASSIRVAVTAVAARVPGAGAILFTVCDQPLVTVDLLAASIREHRAGHDLVAAEYGGGLGVPALFARRFWDELGNLTGDAGARRVLSRHASEVCAMPFPNGVVDVDTPTDAARLADLAGAAQEWANIT